MGTLLMKQLYSLLKLKKKTLRVVDEQTRRFKDSKHSLKVMECVNAADR